MNGRTTARGRELGARLRRARVEAGYDTSHELAMMLGWSHSRVSRMETGAQVPGPLNVAVVLGYCGVPPAERAEILELAADPGADGWWVRPHHDHLPEAVPSVLFLHRTAGTILSWAPTAVPAILQTREYAEADLGARLGRDHTARLGVRLAYQRLLTEPRAPQVVCFLREAVLRAPAVDQQTRLGQLLYLAMLVGDRRASLRIVPAERDHAVPDGEFTLFRFTADHPPAVCAPRETVTVILEHEHVRAYEHSLSELARAALPEPDSARLIARLAGDQVVPT